MDTLVIVLVALLCLFLFGAAYFMFFKKDGPSKGEVREIPANAAIVGIRNVSTPDGPRQRLTIEVDGSLFTENSVMPFDADLEAGMEDDSTSTLLERYHDPKVPEDERKVIAETLRASHGLAVNYKPLGGAASEPAPVDDAGEEGAGGAAEIPVEEETDRRILMGIINHPYKDAALKEAAKRRLQELDAAAAPPADGGASGTDVSEEPETDTGALIPGEDYGGEFMEPDNPGVPLDPQPESEAPVGEGEGEEDEPEYEPEGGAGAGPADAGVVDPLAGFAGGAAAQPAKEPRKDVEPAGQPQAGADAEKPASDGDRDGLVDAGRPLNMTFVEEYDDEEDSRCAVELMGFIADSFNDLLIAPELVEFAQRKLNLRVNRGYWTDEDYARANARIVVYERNQEFVDMKVADLERYVRASVAMNGKARAEEEARREDEARKAAEAAEREKAEAERARRAEEERMAAEAAEQERIERLLRETEAANAAIDASEAVGASGTDVPAGDGDVPDDGGAGDAGAADGGSASGGVAPEAVADGGASVREETAPAPAEEPVRDPEPEVAPAKPVVPELRRIAPSQRPKKAVNRPKSTFFDNHGGRNDLMWERVERTGKK